MIDEQTEQALTAEGFSHVNAAIPVWVPSGEGDSIRGYVLARQVDREGDGFLVVQLTRDYEFGVAAGTVLAVYETHSIRGADRLEPSYHTHRSPDGPPVTVPLAVVEVSIHAAQPWSKAHGWSLEVYARQLSAQQAQPPIGPRVPPFVRPTLELAGVAEGSAPTPTAPPAPSEADVGAVLDAAARPENGAG